MTIQFDEETQLSLVLGHDKYPLLLSVLINGRRCGFIGQTAKILEQQDDSSPWDAIRITGSIIYRYSSPETAVSLIQGTHAAMRARKISEELARTLPQPPIPLIMHT